MRSSSLEAVKPVFKSWLCHSSVVPGLSSLSLSFLFCKVGITVILPYKVAEVTK